MTQQEETRLGYTIPKIMKEAWAVQMELAKKLMEVCSKHNLKVWADGGTLLGAVRHKGYIPWDDDIDMLMFREDYDRLVDIAETEFHSPYFFQCARTEQHYPLGHAQLRKDGTTAITKEDPFLRLHQGIFIDIFVYDSVPEKDNEEFVRRLRRADEIQSALRLASFPEWCFMRPTYIIKYLKARKTVRREGFMKLFNEYEDLFRNNDYAECNYYAPPCFMRTSFKATYKKKEWYRDIVMLPFEDMELPAPIDYDKVLSTQYGDDYMTPRQIPALHLGFAVLDAHRSYKEYLFRLRLRFLLTYPMYIWQSLAKKLGKKER